MLAYVWAYIASLATLAACDFVWLGTVGNGVYRPRLGALLLEQPVFPAAAAFYLVYAAGVVLFAVAPGLRAGAWARSLGAGALFGFFAYATYDLTNLATLRGWSGLVSTLDILWGTVLTAAAAAAGCIAAQRAGF
jgi:uncharacterized membrane protein